MIIRAQRKDTFTIVNNKAINDSRLSFRAKGVLVYILSKPDNWRVSERNLANDGPDGRSAVASALTELEQAGYLQRTRTRNDDGTFAWDSVIYDEPQPVADDAPESESGSQRSTMAGKTVHGLTVRGKPSHIINTEQTNTEQVNTDRAAPPPPTAAEPPSWFEDVPEPETQQPPAPPVTTKALAQQPPVAMYRDIFLRYPSKPQMGMLMSHGIDDLRRWREVLTVWVGRGWSPHNLQGMLDLYSNPQRITELRTYTPRSAPQSLPQRSAQQPADDFAEWLAELSRPGAVG